LVVIGFSIAHHSQILVLATAPMVNARITRILVLLL